MYTIVYMYLYLCNVWWCMLVMPVCANKCANAHDSTYPSLCVYSYSSCLSGHVYTELNLAYIEVPFWMEEVQHRSFCCAGFPKSLMWTRWIYHQPSGLVTRVCDLRTSNGCCFHPSKPWVISLVPFTWFAFQISLVYAFLPPRSSAFTSFNTINMDITMS